MKNIIVSLLFVLALTTTAFSQAKPNSKIETAGESSISGSVISKVSKNLLAGVNVKLQKYSTNPVEIMNAQIQTVRTDENGRWSFKNLKPGEYKIVISPAAGKAADGKQPKLAEVMRIIKVADKDVSNLIIELPLEATISGAIVLKGKNQNPNFTFIIATDEQQDIVSGSPIKNKSFRIENLSEGDFFLNLTAGDEYYVKEIWLGDEDITESAIKLKNGENVSGVRVVMMDDFGTVKGKIDHISEDATILIVLLPVKFTAKNALRSSMPEVVEENGKFEIKAPPGEYFVAIVTPQDMQRRDKNNLEAWFREITEDMPKVVVNAFDVTDVRLKMRQ